MPAYLMHWLTGERVLKQLNYEGISKKTAFYTGCQGPDFFYSNWRSLRSGLSLGIQMHNQKTRELLHHALDFIKEYDKQDKEELISYIAGFITHYAVDKTSHPFIYEKSENKIRKHHVLEYLWDSYIFDREGYTTHSDRILSDCIYSALETSVVSWYISAVKKVYGKKIKREAVVHAHNNFIKNKRSMFIESHKLREFFLKRMGLENKISRDEPRQADLHDTREDCEKINEYLIISIDEACSMIKFMMRYIRGEENQLPDWIGSVNFSGVNLNRESYSVFDFS